MNRNEFFIILVYVMAQLSGFLGIPLLLKNSALTPLEAVAYWTVCSMSVATFISLWLSRPLRQGGKMGKPLPWKETMYWIFIGLFLAYFAQIMSAIIEQKLFHIPGESENTKEIITIAKSVPLFMFVGIILAPFLEELIFRRIIFYHLYQKFSFFIAALTSSLLFAVLHLDFSHLLVYLAMGFVFSFLYVKTNRIIVPMAAHTLMNGTVFYLAFYVNG